MRLKPSQILLPIAGLVVVGLLLQKKAAGALNYFINKIAISFEGFTPILRLDIMIQNPSNQAFVLKSIAGDVTADGTIIGNASMFQTVVIDPNTQKVVSISVRLSPLAVVSDLVSIVTKGSGIPQTLGFKGFVNVNEMVASVNLTYKVG